MVRLVSNRLRRASGLVEDARLRMIRETSLFLTWALAADRQVPRIPSRAMSEGGFAKLPSVPGGRTAAQNWWSKTLALVTLDR